MPRKKRTASPFPVSSNSSSTTTTTPAANNQTQTTPLNDWPTWASELLQAFTTIVTIYEFLARQNRSKVAIRPPSALRFDAIESKTASIATNEHEHSGNKSSLTKYTLARILAIAPKLVTAVHRTHAELDALSAQCINVTHHDHDQNAAITTRKSHKQALDDPYSPYLSSSNNDTATVLVLEFPPIPSNLLVAINHNSSSKTKRMRTDVKGQIDAVMIIQQRVAAFRYVLQQFLSEMVS
jgi:hypothetical protein